jgi:hypothetical protein
MVLMNQGNLTATARLVSGSLPTGLTLGSTASQAPNPTISIAGTPTQSGIFSFTVEVSDSLTPPRTAQVPLKMFIDVRELTFSSGDTFVSGKRTEPYQSTIFTNGGIAPIICSLDPTSTPLPGGLTLNQGCTVTGTPNQNGDFSFTIRATDSGAQQQTVTKIFHLSIIEPIVVGSLPDATTGEIYSALVHVTGGTPPYSFQSASFGGCCFVFERHDFSLHGVPYVPGQMTFGLVISDSRGQQITPALQLKVNEGPFRLGVESLPRAKLGQLYSGLVTVVSGKRPITWTLDSATVTGIDFVQRFDDATFTGFPFSSGSFPLILRATDSSTPPQTLDVPITLHVLTSLGRNDSLQTADSVAGSSYDSIVGRTISPYADPVDLANPDQDYYHYRAFAGDTVEVAAVPWALMDPVLEITDANGQRFSTCRDPSDDTPDAQGKVDLTPLAFDDVCMNDDTEPGVHVDSMVLFRVPGTSGTIVDFYVRVLDFRGIARPELGYNLYVLRSMRLIE